MYICVHGEHIGSIEEVGVVECEDKLREVEDYGKDEVGDSNPEQGIDM